MYLISDGFTLWLLPAVPDQHATDGRAQVQEGTNPFPNQPFYYLFKMFAVHV